MQLARLPEPTGSTLTGLEERLSAGDVLSIHFPYRPAEDRDVVVRPDGRITVPFIGALQVAGRSIESIEAEMTTRLDSLRYDPRRDAGRGRYLLNVGDIIEVRVKDAPQLDATVPVRPDGRISLPLIKSVLAEGLAPEDLEVLLLSAFRKELKVTDLVVIVKEYQSERTYVNGRLDRGGIKDVDGATISVKSFVPRQVYIAGEVRVPGFVTYQSGLSSLQAIVSAGGPLRSGKLDDVLVLRRSRDGQVVVESVSLGGVASGGEGTDLLLEPFDIVIVPKKGIAKVTDALDQYLYQLIPATRNVNFTYFYDIGGRRP